MAVLAAHWLLELNFYIIIPYLVCIYLMIIGWGSYFIQSDYFVHTICRGNGSGKQIAITFDDGPEMNVTPVVLDILKKNNAKATFFCIGRKITGNENLIGRMHAEGHQIGNHSWSHSYFFDLFRDQRVEKELVRFNTAVAEITGSKVIYFRPPYGVTNPVIARVVKKLGMPVIGWSIRSLDTTIRDPELLFNRVSNKLKSGDIVLFHDSHPRIIPVLEKFLQHCRQQGFETVTAEKLLRT